jgi:hypothetical protein
MEGGTQEMRITLLGVLAGIGVVAVILLVANHLSKANDPRVESNEPSNAVESSDSLGSQDIQ